MKQTIVCALVEELLELKADDPTIQRFIQRCAKLADSGKPPCPACFASNAEAALDLIGGTKTFLHFRCRHCRQSFSVADPGF